MEDLKEKIMGFQDWSDRERGLALLRVQKGEFTLFSGVPAASLQAALEAELGIGACLLPDLL